MNRRGFIKTAIAGVGAAVVKALIPASGWAQGGLMTHHGSIAWVGEPGSEVFEAGGYLIPEEYAQGIIELAKNPDMTRAENHSVQKHYHKMYKKNHRDDLKDLKKKWLSAV